jgi:hypothetical protein
VFEDIRQELAIFWIRGARATTRLRRDRRRAIPKPKFTLLLKLVIKGSSTCLKGKNTN